jgi:predicted phosphatase
MFLKSLRFIALAFVCSSLQPLTASPKKCILFGIKNVLLYPDMKKVSGGSLGGLLGFTPGKVEKELFDTLEPINVPFDLGDRDIPISGDIYPLVIDAWLRDRLSNAQVHEITHHYVKKHFGLLSVKGARLKTAVNIAFSDQQARTFSPIDSMVALAHRCKNAGHIIETCTSWNRQSFENLKSVQSDTLSIFYRHNVSYNHPDHRLAAEPDFYTDLINKYGLENIVLIDSLPENLKAFKDRGGKIIKYTSAAQVERELRNINFLS